MFNFEAYSFVLFLCIIISTILIWAKFFKSINAKPRHPPTPFGLPIIGHLHLLNSHPHQAFHKLSLRYGPIFRVFMGSVPCVVACSPEITKEFLNTNKEAFSNRPDSSTQAYITYGSKDFVFAPYGPYWKFMKKITMSRLLNGKTLDLLSSVRHDKINCFVKVIYGNAKIGTSLDLSGELMKLTNNVISRMVWNKRCTDKEGEADEFGRVIAELTEIGGSFNLSDYVWLLKTLDVQGLGRKAKDAQSRFDAVVERIVKEHDERRRHNENREVKDLIDILLDIQQYESMEIKLSRENIKAFIMNLIIAATDTSASTLEWALAELINNPHIRNKAAQEIHEIVGENRLVQESDIPNLPYLQAIVKETLRLYPTVPVIPRKSSQNCTVGGYHIPANTNTFINVWALNRDHKHWENPHEFRPERFEENMLDVRGQNFQLLTFGSGRKMCPGISLAQHIVHTTLGAMIQCFEWKAGKDGNLRVLIWK
ncbi:cytochrome P450 93A3-like protein [Tanacetum coccineum]